MGGGFGPHPYIMRHIKFFFTGLGLMAGALVMVGLALLVLMGLLWVLYHYVWIYYLVAGVFMAYMVGMDYYGNADE